MVNRRGGHDLEMEEEFKLSDGVNIERLVVII